MASLNSSSIAPLKVTNRASGVERERSDWCPGGRGSPLGKDPPDMARRRITDVVNRSKAEMDAPQSARRAKRSRSQTAMEARRRDSPHALPIRPTIGRLVHSPKRFEVGRRRTPEQILAEGFHCRFNSLRTLSDNVKRYGVFYDDYRPKIL